MVNKMSFSLFNPQLLCFHYNYRFSMAVSDKLQPLIQLDPLLLPQLVYICPTHQISSLFAVIPPSVSASWLHYSLVPETGDPLCVSYYIPLALNSAERVQRGKPWHSMFMAIEICNICR